MVAVLQRQLVQFGGDWFRVISRFDHIRIAVRTMTKGQALSDVAVPKSKAPVRLRTADICAHVEDAGHALQVARIPVSCSPGKASGRTRGASFITQRAPGALRLPGLRWLLSLPV
ncbi:hypothetical protein ABB29_02880 [Pseudoxanthomonas dokdonensis]|uniref:Uncharacterized protein n=1 Tax=Pseudoxanthomonas dokdonensis TaxID=344882 RepID=A0A0R0D0Q6_9GAMM|nr:hypothetical protein ABB29_02880 [Pseudoxanthomonas dokdonensis]